MLSAFISQKFCVQVRSKRVYNTVINHGYLSKRSKRLSGNLAEGGRIVSYLSDSRTEIGLINTVSSPPPEGCVESFKQVAHS